MLKAPLVWGVQEANDVARAEANVKRCLGALERAHRQFLRAGEQERADEVAMALACLTDAKRGES